MDKLKFSFLLVLLLFSYGHPIYSQSDTLKLCSFEKVDSLNAITPKNIIIYFHTDWCKFCQLMDQTTFKDEDVINLLNEKFYFISFNPECAEIVAFAGKKFEFIPKGNKSGIHEIATELATVDGKVNYPSICILNQDYEIVFQYNQYLSAAELIKVLNEVLLSKR